MRLSSVEEPAVSSIPEHDLLGNRSEAMLATTIAERRSQEVVVALIGPVASGVSTAARYVHDILSTDFGYNVCPIIKLSDFIRKEAHRVEKTNLSTEPLDKYITEMQSAGNRLREAFGGDYLAEKAVEQIYKFRQENGGISDTGILLPGRRAYVIDSLKNPEELELLRSIYRESLCVFGVFAPDDMRASRLKDKGIPKSAIKNIMDRDRGEIATFGQKTRKIFVDADFFVCNDRKEEELRSKISRFLSISFNTAIHTPTRAESAMYKASSAAANSACMSRQVGAAIVSEAGELIGIGWNDVPRFGGGLYTEDHQFLVVDGGVVDKDNRCFKWGGRICHNEIRRNQIIDNIVKKVAESGVLKKGIATKHIRELLKGTDVDSLIEFSRSIHAEMEAILSVAREGRHSLVNATLYCTTYPCHNCARHIVASGIKSVVYIEPYEKSLAVALHHDSVTEDPEDRSRVNFRQYNGVAPRNYLRLFRPTVERKSKGRLVTHSQKSAVPVFQVPLDSLKDYETKVIADLSSKEQTSI